MTVMRVRVCMAAVGVLGLLQVHRLRGRSLDTKSEYQVWFAERRGVELLVCVSVQACVWRQRATVVLAQAFRKVGDTTHRATQRGAAPIPLSECAQMRVGVYMA